jgi:hypothetical protein
MSTASTENNLFAKALGRNRQELAVAIAETLIVQKMARSGTTHSFDFFRFACVALQYGYVARAIKIFDRHRVLGADQTLAMEVARRDDCK